MDNITEQWDRALVACMTFPSSLEADHEADAARYVYPYTDRRGHRRWRALNPHTNKYKYATGEDGYAMLLQLVIAWRFADEEAQP